MSILDINNVILLALLIISIFGIVLSAWSVDTFRKLKEKNATLDNCKVESSSVNSGLTFAAIMLSVSLIVFIYCCASMAAKAGYLKL